MKKLILCKLSVVVAMSVAAQTKKSTELTPTKQMEYQVYVQGHSLTYLINVDSMPGHQLSVRWQSSSGREGRYIISKSALDSAQYGYWNPPQPGATIELEKEQSLLLISKANFQRLKQQGNMLYDGNTFQSKPTAANAIYKMGDIQVDCVYAETTDGGTKIWIYNNPHLPVILKIEGNPFGVDMELTGIHL